MGVISRPINTLRFQYRLETAGLQLCDALQIVKQTEDGQKLVKGETVHRISQNWKECCCPPTTAHCRHQNTSSLIIIIFVIYRLHNYLSEGELKKDLPGRL